MPAGEAACFGTDLALAKRLQEHWGREGEQGDGTVARAMGPEVCLVQTGPPPRNESALFLGDLCSFLCEVDVTRRCFSSIKVGKCIINIRL